jgi:transitional endoplasmic reticulum ATPase
MEHDLRQLEQSLLKQPFNQQLRTDYATALSALGQYEAAIEQWQLVIQQNTKAARPHIELAFCLHHDGQPEAAAKQLVHARQCADFDDVQLDLDDARRALLKERQVVPLRLVSTADAPRSPADVISISRAAKTRFSDIAGMSELKQLLKLKIIEPFLRPGLFQRFKKVSGGGVLLYGPPGCGKTMMARAIASECNASFTAIGISDVLSMWIGESQRNLAAVFEKARDEKPAVLFFDEIDALAYSRSKANSDHTRSTVNEFLNQLDGLSGNNEGILVLGATNMPWDVDEAMKRPGRFDRQIFVPPPDAAARQEMFELKLRDVPVGALDTAVLARKAVSFSGADIDGVIEMAKESAIARAMSGNDDTRLEQVDLLEALEISSPSTIDWLNTARNLVKFGGAAKTYKDVEKYLREAKLY